MSCHPSAILGKRKLTSKVADPGWSVRVYVCTTGDQGRSVSGGHRVVEGTATHTHTLHTLSDTVLLQQWQDVEGH